VLFLCSDHSVLSWICYQWLCSSIQQPRHTAFSTQCIELDNLRFYPHVSWNSLVLLLSKSVAHKHAVLLWATLDLDYVMIWQEKGEVLSVSWFVRDMGKDTKVQVILGQGGSLQTPLWDLKCSAWLMSGQAKILIDLSLQKKKIHAVEERPVLGLHHSYHLLIMFLGLYLNLYICCSKRKNRFFIFFFFFFGPVKILIEQNNPECWALEGSWMSGER